MLIVLILLLMFTDFELSGHGGLSQWGRSNRPRIRSGTVKSLNAPWELSKLCRMLFWLGPRTVP